ncbi:MAG: hypothetical protein KF794_14280 [Xanthobacteraceae bacterium]|nr:hypothetical protein [Xanthobacteraceae bacterium]QYK44902.1 MAG: hypothetical protein KF794_14280 [Xanthobacteraceae bacterium]
MPARLLAIVLLLAAPFAAQAREPWQIGHGPFLTAADVSAHNKFPQDMADIRALLAGEKPDWAGALSLYAYGRHFKAHSVARFADNYNGRLDSYLPVSAKHYGSASFQNAFLFAALANTGRFARASEAERKAALDAGMTALLINYARYELGEAQRKASATQPNWSLQNGAPKNWSEAFAFYYGPEGKHGAFEAIAALPNGERLNARILQALADGQPDLLRQKWPQEAADELAAALNVASIALFRNALEAADKADDAGLALMRARAAGFWLAAGEPILRTDRRAPMVEKALTGTPDREAIKAALAVIAPLPGE